MIPTNTTPFRLYNLTVILLWSLFLASIAALGRWYSTEHIWPLLLLWLFGSICITAAYRYLYNQNRVKAEAIKRHSAIMDASLDAIITIDSNGIVRDINPATEITFGYSRSQMIGADMAELIIPHDLRAQHHAGLKRHLDTGESRIMGSRIEITALHADGHTFPIELTITRLNIAGEAIFTAHLRDLTETKKLKESIDHHKTHDSLTDLINRTTFEHNLGKLLQKSTASSHHCLLYMDLDQFHIINESSSHAMGDEMLCQIGQLLLTNKREEDVLARLGSDEFALLLESREIFNGVEVANKMIELVKKYRLPYEGHSLQTTLSVGIFPIDDDDTEHTQLLSLAESACEMAKENGRGRLYIYDQNDLNILQHRVDIDWIHRIQSALDSGRFVLYRQTMHPLANDIQTDKAFFEILLRMQDTEGNIISPHQFIAAAERYNLMPSIDKWVIENTFNWLSKQDNLTDTIKLCSINLSALSINDPLFAQFIRRQLKKYSIPPNIICFEITETAAITNMAKATQFLQSLHEAGCLFALDDFGTGSASYAYLKALPVDYLKIDGSFIQDITTNKINYTMVKSINEIGKVMGKLTIAEHVEDVSTIEILQQIGLDYAQGYIFSLPQRIDDK